MTRYKATPDGNVPFTPEEEAAWDAMEAEYAAGADDRAAAEVRKERDAKLAATDWTASTDVTMTSEMTAYRQALRDVPAQAGFPNTIDWPEV
ncbi:phage tail assembly chaperone [Alphaproteobacteria bacterium]|nr:phage tail assembly chaperone [Alphaproteobacteria bacterium]